MCFYRKYWARREKKSRAFPFKLNYIMPMQNKSFFINYPFHTNRKQVQIYVDHYKKNKSKVYAKLKLMKAPIKSFLLSERE